MKPLLHAKISANHFGGKPENYIDIHDWFDQTKAHIPDARHRQVLHNAFGIFLCEQQFGDRILLEDGSIKKMPYITLANGKQVSVRDIAEQHVLDDLGCIPTLQDCMKDLQIDINFSGGMTKLRLASGTKFRIVD